MRGFRRIGGETGVILRAHLAGGTRSSCRPACFGYARYRKDRAGRAGHNCQAAAGYGSVSHPDRSAGCETQISCRLATGKMF